MRILHFYSTRDDLLPVLGAVESRIDVYYRPSDQSLKPECATYSRGSEIPNLGIASSESAVTCTAYLVLMRDREPQFDRINRRDGSTRYDLSQLLNPTSITFSPGGVWKDNVLLYGRVDTVSGDGEAQLLMKEFAKEIRKAASRRIGAYWIGPQAYAFLKQGKRLTLAEQCPPEVDLREDGAEH